MHKHFKVQWKKTANLRARPTQHRAIEAWRNRNASASLSELEREFTVNEIVNICADYCGIVAPKNASDQSALNRALEYKEGKDGLYRWLEKNYPCIKTTVSNGN